MHPNKDPLLHTEEYLEKGLSTRVTALQLSCTKTTVTARLQVNKVKLRKPNQPHGNPSIPKYGQKVVDGKLHAYVAERRVIRAILEMRGAGLSLRQIASVLDSMGMPTKLRGKAWHPEMVSRILKAWGAETLIVVDSDKV